MAFYDTLQYAGVERSFGAWGFAQDGVFGDKVQLHKDTFTCRIPKANISDDPVFAFESSIIVRASRVSADGSDGSFSGGVVKFQGKRILQPAKADASGEGVTYQFEGPSYDLEMTQFQQTYKGVSVNPYSPGEVILNTTTATASKALQQISIGDQIQAILQFVLDQYSAQGMAAPFQYKGRTFNPSPTPHIDLTSTGIIYPVLGSAVPYIYGLDPASTIDPILFKQFQPTFVEKPNTCMTFLKKCLELQPRTSMAFDHTTIPPTVHVKNIDNFVPVTLPLFDGVSHKSVRITRRDDLVPRAIVLTYRITSTVNGKQQLDYAVDKWGPNGANNSTDPSGGLRVVVDTIDLTGFNETTEKGQLDCEPLGAIGGTTATKRAWWSSKRGGELAKLIDSRIRFQSVTAANINVTAATNASPIAITTATAHGLSTGARVFIGQVGGNLNANGSWIVTVTGGSTFTLNGSTGSGAYTSGGVATCYVNTPVSIPDARYFYATAGKDVTGAVVVAGEELTAEDYAFYTCRLVRGAHHPWMQLPSGDQVLAVKVKAYVPFTHVEYDALTSGDVASQLPVNETTTDADQSGNVMHKTNATEHHVDMELTNGTPGLNFYESIGSFTAGESYTIGVGGIAQYLFNALQKIQYEGDYVKVATNFDNGVSLLNTLNFSGGRTEWLTMNAQIQGIREDYGRHETSVQIGLARHLSARQLSSLLNMWRNRRTWYNPQIRADNTAGGSGGEVDMASATGGPANTSKGTETAQSQVAIHYVTPNVPSSGVAATINADASIHAGILENTTPTPAPGFTATDVKTIQPREVQLCDSGGNLVYAVLHACGFYTK